jgi:TPR repeat protein
VCRSTSTGGRFKLCQKSDFIEYLKLSPENLEAWLSLARILEQQGNEREALNAFEQAREITNPEDCIKIGNLYLKKKILVQAEKWFKEAAKKASNPTAEPLLGLLRVKIANADEDSAEALILAIEKAYPKKLASLDVAKNLKNILVKRRISELNNRSIIIQNSTVSDLAQALLQKPKEIDEPVVSTGP